MLSLSAVVCFHRIEGIHSCLLGLNTSIAVDANQVLELLSPGLCESEYCVNPVLVSVFHLSAFLLMLAHN